MAGKKRMDSLPRKISGPVRDRPEAGDGSRRGGDSRRTWCRTFCREPVLDLLGSRGRSPAPDDGANHLPDRRPRAAGVLCLNSAERTSCSSLAAAAVGRHAPGRAGSVTPASWCRRARLLRCSRQVRLGSQDLLRAPNRRAGAPARRAAWNQPPRGVIGGHARGPQIAAVLDGRADQVCSLGGPTDRTIGTQRCGRGLSSGPQISDLLLARTGWPGRPAATTSTERAAMPRQPRSSTPPQPRSTSCSAAATRLSTTAPTFSRAP